TFLESLYEYHPAAARPRLIQAYLAQAKITKKESERLAFYEQVLTLSPEHPEASAAKREIWKRRGDMAFKDGQLKIALEAYQQTGLHERVAEIQAAIQRRELEAGLQRIEELEAGRKYQEAFDLAQQLRETHLKARNWEPDLERLEQKTQLDELYQRGLGALQSGEGETAQKLLGTVVSIEPTYEQAARYLYQAVSGEDVDVLKKQQTEAHNLRAELTQARTIASRYKSQHQGLLLWSVSGSILLTYFSFCGLTQLLEMVYLLPRRQ
ncbi:MAG: hypothetical protein AB1649_27465, partial [Chloroflexota bacterium]